MSLREQHLCLAQYWDEITMDELRTKVYPVVDKCRVTEIVGWIVLTKL